MAADHLVHWADMTAERIIRQLGDKDQYVLASGITPSGVVHFGNFREVITVDFVARALRDKGKKVRFIFSWDDYDTFRKIPANMPKKELLEQYMFRPIVDTPDPYAEHSSYADHHEKKFMAQLEKVGIQVEPLFQAQKYRSGLYNLEMKKTLQHAQEIRDILNQYRKEPLSQNWLPISIYCSECNRDKMKSVSYDNNDTLTYECELCAHKGEENIKTSKRLKLPWRMDWPMRWAFEKVDFEPGGKDHSSQGGSFSTAKEIVQKVFNWQPPIYLQYDFVSIKGGGGKMSSSKGDVITVNDVLAVYEPEMIRWIFASYKSNVDFSVSFDLDVIKTYEDYDRMERVAYGIDKANEKKFNMAKRAYELAQLDGAPPKEMPFQPAFRHLCNILQINDGNIEKTRDFYSKEIKNDRDERRFQQRAQRAWYWIEHYAPEDFKYRLNKNSIDIEVDTKQQNFLQDFTAFLHSSWDEIEDDKTLHEKMYEIIHQQDIQPADIFPILYRKLINKEKGPKLAGFIRTIGKEKVLDLIGQ